MNALERMDLAIRLARGAGAILRASYGKAHEVGYKGRINLVTEADKASESWLTAELAKAVPGELLLAEEEGTRILGEMAVTANPIARKGAAIDWSALAGRDVWLVDPLDGTTNYAHHLPVFAVSIGYVQQGVPVCGVIYDPMRDELFSAAKGHGARLDGAQIHVSECPDLGKALLVSGFPYDIADPALASAARPSPVELFVGFLGRAQSVRRLGSAALDLAYVAAGRFDGHFEVGLSPWDTAAGWCLVTEAGGTVSGFAGEPFSPFEPRVLASNGALHGSLLEALRDMGASGT